MLNTKFSPWPDFTEEEVDAVACVIRSNKVNYWTGTECRDFEKEFASWCSVDNAIAVNNGTVALEIALRALGVGPGDEVIVTARSFFASASCIVACGAIPVFADIDPNTHNLSSETIAPLVTKNTKAVICVHLAGLPCEMTSIMALAERHNFFVVEDCAQAHGARYKDRSVGGIGHVGAWSFCQDKIMTTGGEGGMITTNSKALWERMWSYKDHGKSWDSVYEKEHPQGFRWVHDSFGTNARMLEVQAVIGRIQLKKLPNWQKARAKNAGRLAEICRSYSEVTTPTVPNSSVHAYYRFYASIDAAKLKANWSRDKIVASIQAAGVPCMQGSCAEMYREQAFANTGYRPATRLPVARLVGETSFAMLVHPTLSESEIQISCDTLNQVLGSAIA